MGFLFHDSSYSPLLQSPENSVISVAPHGPLSSPVWFLSLLARSQIPPAARAPRRQEADLALCWASLYAISMFVCLLSKSLLFLLGHPTCKQNNSVHGKGWCQKCPNLSRIFRRVYLNQNWWQSLGHKIFHALENDNFTVSLNAFGIQEGTEGRLQEGGEKHSKDWITGQVRLCALSRVVMPSRDITTGITVVYEPGCTRTMEKAALQPFTKEVTGLGRDHPPRPAQLEMYDLSQHPFFVRIPFLNPKLPAVFLNK